VPKREYKLPESHVSQAIEAFKSDVGDPAASIIEALKIRTVQNPESGKLYLASRRTMVISPQFSFTDEDIVCQVHYEFNELAVKWLLFKWQKNPKPATG